MKIYAWLCLALALLAFTASLFAVIEAPTIPLFRLEVAVTEFGHWLFLFPLAVAFAAPRGSWLTLLLAAAACALCLLSSVRAHLLARDFTRAISLAFPKLPPAPAPPFAWHRLWLPASTALVPVEAVDLPAQAGGPLSLRFYRCQNRPVAPCVVVIHGGGWESGSPEEFTELNHHLARRGYAVAAVAYRFAPRWPWPAQRDDVLTALRYLQEHAATLGLDPAQFILLGRSAGGQIAESIAYGAHEVSIRGCIAFYAPADMHFAYEFARDDDILSSPKIVRQFMGGTPAEVPANFDSASPILLANAQSPPTLLLHGHRDELVWYLQSQRLSTRLTQLGIPHYLLLLPWATHAFDYNLHGPGGQLSTYAVERFLATVTH